ncbi:MAG TPA: GNAT family N-acetyltransferase [Solirubrobacteraceae bacterium]|jgi:GNAT superfamily N-acetyltransferase|nr:GNAT family N-acetyltransferase [Solirubrobacteraceae bacterium]
MVRSTHVLWTTGEDPAARELLARITADWTPVYGPPIPGDPASIVPSDLPHYVALLDGERPVAGGGLRPLGGRIAEVKRMYVMPDRRGEGLARRLLDELEALARDAGYERLRLDATGTLPRLYRSAGFHEIPDYNGNPHASFWAEKPL